MDAAARRAALAGIARDNAAALTMAVERCVELGVGAFRITSQLLPLATHPLSGYALEGLDDDGTLVAAYRAAGRLAAERGVRLSFHPDQFVVLNSEREETVAAAVRELDFTAALCDLVGADAMTVHGGGLAGGTAAAVERLGRGLDRLGPRARALLVLENDDRLFTPADLLPLCRSAGVPLVYDVHHHRCHPDGRSVAEATEAAAATWGAREPWAHISSPRDGWGSANPRPHADHVDPADFPEAWLGRRMTIDVEAKAKERAVVAIRDAVRGGSAAARPGV
jgi:UV DNA damage endonuclease